MTQVKEITAQLVSLRIVSKADDYADLSDLDQFENSTDKEERKYYKQDQKRKAAYGDTWYMLGIYAEATIKTSSGMTHKVRSGGLWGIESDSDASYFREVAREEVAQLTDELAALHIDASQLAELESAAIEEMTTRF
ncbi:MAG: hypothetical protein NVS3B25_19030 [Hymenobacter sp.]